MCSMTQLTNPNISPILNWTFLATKAQLSYVDVHADLSILFCKLFLSHIYCIILYYLYICLHYDICVYFCCKILSYIKRKIKNPYNQISQKPQVIDCK